MRLPEGSRIKGGEIPIWQSETLRQIDHLLMKLPNFTSCEMGDTVGSATNNKHRLLILKPFF